MEVYQMLPLGGQVARHVTAESLEAALAHPRVKNDEVVTVWVSQYDEDADDYFWHYLGNHSVIKG